MDLLASSMIILFPPRIKIVTAFVLVQPSMIIIRSFVVPKAISLTRSARPNFSGVISSNRGTIRPPVAMAINSISTPPTHLTAGSSLANNT
jgi:hypothetical protein